MLPDIHVGSNVAIHNHQTKLWDLYGMVTDIGPHRKYYIGLPSRILVRNRRLIHRRVPASIPPDSMSTGVDPHRDSTY